MWDTYNWTELELEPYEGERGLVPIEEEEPQVRSPFGGYYTGGMWGEPGWVPPSIDEPEPMVGSPGVVTPSTSGLSDKTRDELRKKAARILKTEEELEGLRRKAEIEELKSKRRQYRREHRPQVGKTIRTWLKPRPSPDLAKIFFPGRALRETYIPRPPVRTTVEQIKAIREVSAPEMGIESSLGQAVVTNTEGLKRAGSPPPATRIRTPARNPEEFEGLGPALVRLRSMGTLRGADQAVLTEVAGNGDIDTPSHVRSEVSRLGFSTKEVDASLKRLRDLGFLIPSGRVQNGERELMLSGGSHG